MKITFPCSFCNATLRVPAESVGKFARCPNCDATQPIPADGAGRSPAVSRPMDRPEASRLDSEFEFDDRHEAPVATAPPPRVRVTRADAERTAPRKKNGGIGIWGAIALGFVLLRLINMLIKMAGN